MLNVLFRPGYYVAQLIARVTGSFKALKIERVT